MRVRIYVGRVRQGNKCVFYWAIHQLTLDSEVSGHGYGVSRKLVRESKGAKVPCVFITLVFIFVYTQTPIMKKFLWKCNFCSAIALLFYVFFVCLFVFKLFSKSSRCIISSSFSFSVFFSPPPFFYHGKQFLSCDCRGEDLFLTVNWSEKRSFLDAGRCKRWGEDKVKWSSFFKNNLVFLGDVNDKPRTFFIAGCPCLWMRVLSPDTELSR